MLGLLLSIVSADGADSIGSLQSGVVTLLAYTKDLADADATFSYQRIC